MGAKIDHPIKKMDMAFYCCCGISENSGQITGLLSLEQQILSQSQISEDQMFKSPN